MSRERAGLSCTKTRSQGTCTSSKTIIESDSSKRWASGLWNSIPCAEPNGLRAQSETPGAFTGTAQVTDSLTWLGASGMMLPIQSSSANTAPVASIFIPLSTTPALSSAVTLSVGGLRSALW